MADSNWRTFSKGDMVRLPPFVVTEIGRDGPGDDDQRVVRDARAVGERDHAPLGVDLVGFAHQDLHVPLAAEHGAERTGNLAGRQASSGDLIEERLEETHVAAVDQRDFGGCTLQGAHCA